MKASKEFAFAQMLATPDGRALTAAIRKQAEGPCTQKGWIEMRGVASQCRSAKDWFE